MLKIRRPLGRLIFNMGIAIPGKTVFLIETAPWALLAPDGPHVGPMNLAIRDGLLTVASTLECFVPHGSSLMPDLLAIDVSICLQHCPLWLCDVCDDIYSLLSDIKERMPCHVKFGLVQISTFLLIFCIILSKSKQYPCWSNLQTSLVSLRYTLMNPI